MNILIANDEQLIRFGLKLMLEGLWPGSSISEADTLDGVVELLSQNTFNLMILDMHMPGSEGLEDVIRFMLAETSVIILSGYEPTSLRIASLKAAGVGEFIFQDECVESIKAKIRHVLNFQMPN